MAPCACPANPTRDTARALTRLPLASSWHSWDQPILTYLAYHLRASAFRGLSIVFQRRGRGVANTIGAFSGKWTRRGKDGRQDGGKLFPHLDVPHFLARHMDTRGLVLNSDGSPSAIVHQYDRILTPANAVHMVRFAALAAAV